MRSSNELDHLNNSLQKLGHGHVRGLDDPFQDPRHWDINNVFECALQHALLGIALDHLKDLVHDVWRRHVDYLIHGAPHHAFLEIGLHGLHHLLLGNDLDHLEIFIRRHWHIDDLFGYTFRNALPGSDLDHLETFIRRHWHIDDLFGYTLRNALLGVILDHLEKLFHDVRQGHVDGRVVGLHHDALGLGNNLDYLKRLFRLLRFREEAPRLCPFPCTPAMARYCGQENLTPTYRSMHDENIDKIIPTCFYTLHFLSSSPFKFDLAGHVGNCSLKDSKKTPPQQNSLPRFADLPNKKTFLRGNLRGHHPPRTSCIWKHN